MQHDQARVEETAGWFRKASNDLRAAVVDLDVVPPLTEDALFHCQQAVEKALKGFLAWHDQPFRKTHSLVELGMQFAELEPNMEALLREAAKLSGYATQYRYPGETQTATTEEAAEALRLAEEVVAQVLALLPARIQS